MAEVYTTEERPRDTVVVDKDHDVAQHRNNTGLIVALVIIGLILLFLLFARPFGGGGGGTTDVTPSAPTSQPTAQ